jgi:hypothetical protein
LIAKPELTELERLKLENYGLRAYVLETQLRQVGQERVQFIQQMEKQHPGWQWRDPEGWVPDGSYAEDTGAVKDPNGKIEERPLQ